MKFFKWIPFTLAPPNMKYLGINLTKYVQISLKKLQNFDELKFKELNKWRNILCSWTGRLNIVRISVLPNLICRFSAITIKILAICFVDIDKPILKFTQRSRRLQITNTVLEEMKKVGELSFLDLKTYYKATIFKTVWYWWKNR